jgi:hypothetical protein
MLDTSYEKKFFVKENINNNKDIKVNSFNII